jgi:hypothetical protein
MSPREEKLQRRAVKAGIRVAKRRRHVLSESELRDLKVQIVPVSIRLILGVFSILCLVAAGVGWPSGAEAIMVMAGLLLAVCAIFGFRRSLGHILDHMPVDVAIELVGEVIGSIAGAVGDAIDL